MLSPKALKPAVRRSSARTIALGLLVTLITPADARAAGDTVKQDLLPVFQEHCVKCHGKNDKVKGKVNLHKFKSIAQLEKDPELVGKLIEALDLREMPPDDEPPLPSRQRQLLVNSLKDILHLAVSGQKTLLPTPIRRMNRFQYNNAVRDLFELNVDVFALPERMLRSYGYFKPETGRMPNNLKAGSRPLGKSQLIDKRLAGVTPFPQDLRAEHGFDNQADHLSLSPLLLESFLKLSRSIVESADFNQITCGIWGSFFEPPQEEDVEGSVRDRLSRFLTHAFRRPVDEAVLNRYVKHVRAQIDSGESFTAAMKSVASATLASPRFLYLYDRTTASNIDQEDDFHLASRLSFFLWGSIPDQPLLDLAAAGKLSDPAMLEQQVNRMLQDRRLKRFCDSFPSQWLQLERIISSLPDPKRYPDFYFAKFRVSMHMMLEPLLLFETLLVENRSILELIDSDFSYRSDLLNSWYRGDGLTKQRRPTAIPFKRVPITDRRQGGVITTSAVMTMTSSPLRTQPITRGAWIASVIFNDPPEPPPADVPPLSEEQDQDTQQLTLRERFALHRKRADCAGCHAKIDPLGFALENYDATGVWRDTYENDRPVDATGVLFKRHEFKNIIEFKEAILAEKDRFTRAFAGHLLSFSLGRELGIADAPTLDHIVSRTSEAGYRFHPLIKEIVLSAPFLQRSTKMETAER